MSSRRRSAWGSAFFLRNPIAREGVSGTWRTVGEISGAMRVLPMAVSIDRRSGFTARELVLRFDVQQGMDGHGIAIDAAWLADAELVVVRMSPAGSVERDLYIKDFRVDLPSRSASSLSR